MGVVRVAVLDDGINSNVYSVKNVSTRLEVKHGLILDCDDHPGVKSHGTCCAAIIEKYARVPIEIVSIKIINDNGRGTANDLIKAMEYCIENQIDVINLSCGTLAHKDGKVIKKYLSSSRIVSKIVIAAAQNNSNVYTYPACLSQTIGVRKKAGYHDALFDLYLSPRDGIEIEASSLHSLTTVELQPITTYPSNSFAAPMISGLICNIVGENDIRDKKSVLRILRDYATNVIR